jgi:hypothetical protein
MTLHTYAFINFFLVSRLRFLFMMRFSYFGMPTLQWLSWNKADKFQACIKASYMLSEAQRSCMSTDVWVQVENKNFIVTFVKHSLKLGNSKIKTEEFKPSENIRDTVENLSYLQYLVFPNIINHCMD